MDWTYCTVSASEFSLVKLYFEKEKRHHVENPQRPLNEYAYHTDKNGSYQINSIFLEPIQEEIKTEKLSELWRMNFDGAYSKTGKGVGVVIISPERVRFSTLLSDWSLKQLTMWRSMRHFYWALRLPRTWGSSFKY